MLPHGLTPLHHTFALTYLENGFNATAAYRATYPKAKQRTCEVNGHGLLRLAKVRAFLKERLEDAWRPLHMGADEALGRIALLASDDPDSRVKLAALRTVLEQAGKLKTLPQSVDALAAAIRDDYERHKNV
jgi:Terminase small subunit